MSFSLPDTDPSGSILLRSWLLVLGYGASGLPLMVSTAELTENVCGTASPARDTCSLSEKNGSGSPEYIRFPLLRTWIYYAHV